MEIRAGFQIERAGIIARMFLREARRQGGLVISFIVYASLIFSLPLFSRFALGQEVELVLEMIGDSAAIFSIILCALLIGSINERERTSKTDTLLLSKPVRVDELLIGRISGVMALILATTILSFALSIYPLWSAEPVGHRDPVPFGHFIEGYGIELVKVMVLSTCRAALVSGFLVILGPYLAPFGTFVAAVMIFFLSTINHYLFSGFFSGDSGMKYLGFVVRATLPNTSIADVGEYLGRGEEIPWEIPLINVLYVAIYLLALTIVGHFLWSRREV
ncbi:MAG: hypothetical protein NUW37_15820 [Planctomycetes bacterium]|nr:hypothetical protein [Planctomycetota bacterium]